MYSGVISKVQAVCSFSFFCLFLWFILDLSPAATIVVLSRVKRCNHFHLHISSLPDLQTQLQTIKENNTSVSFPVMPAAVPHTPSMTTDFYFLKIQPLLRLDFLLGTVSVHLNTNMSRSHPELGDYLPTRIRIHVHPLRIV